MADSEKVIGRLEELERCTLPGQYATISGIMIRALLSLLKKQEIKYDPVIQSITDLDGYAHQWYACGVCGRTINPYDKYCHECGRAVKWDVRDE